MCDKTMDDSSETAKTNSNNNSSNGSQQQIARNLEERKKGLKLDFSSPESTKKSLTTPDIINLNVEAFLKSFTSGLASEGLTPALTPSQYLVNGTTPTLTPTQFLCPKNVTAEQEQYARGFIDALNHIYQAEKFVPPAPSLLSPGFVAQTVVGGVVVTEGNSGGNTGLNKSPSSSSTQNHPVEVANEPTVLSSANNNNTRTIILTIQNPGGEPKLQKVTDVANSKLLSNPSISYSNAQDAVTNFIKMQQQQTGGVFPIPFTSANSGISYPIGLFNGSGINLPNGTNVSSNHNSLLHFPQGTVQVKPEPPEELHTSIINDGHTVMVNNTGYSTSPRPSPFVSGKYNVRGATTATPPMTTGGSYRNSPVPAGLQAPPMNTYANLTVVQPSQQQESLANSESCGDDSSDDDDGGDGDSRSVSSTSGSPYFGRSSALKREFCELTDVGHPLPPEVQEALKLERKRARNRLAATKCRARKIQRIEQLEGEVNAVKSRNASLASKAELLRNQVAELRRLLAAHHSQGCKVPLDVGGGSR